MNPATGDVDAAAARAGVNLDVVGRDQWAVALATECAYGAPPEQAAARALAHLRVLPDYYWREQQLVAVGRTYWAVRERPRVERSSSALAPRGATVERASALHSMVLRSAHYATKELDASAHHHRHSVHGYHSDDDYSLWWAGGAACIFLFFLLVLAASTAYTTCPPPP